MPAVTSTVNPPALLTAFTWQTRNPASVAISSASPGTEPSASAIQAATQRVPLPPGWPMCSAHLIHLADAKPGVGRNLQRVAGHGAYQFGDPGRHPAPAPARCIADALG